jgi:S-adenosylmethionine hydrolase
MALITLTSDIGIRDYLVGAIKARLFSIVDISHNIPPFNSPQAAYLCRNAIRHFPEFTYHIILVNLFEKKPEHLLLAFYQNQYILCADNGLLSMITEQKPDIVVGIPLEEGTEINTLYIATVFGNAIRRLAGGELLEKIGKPDVEYTELNPLKALHTKDTLEGQIIFIDNFENVVVNITKEEFEKNRQGRKFRIVFRRDEVIDRFSESYADVKEGEVLAFFNSAGYLEIAINKGNAAGLLGLKGFADKASGQVSGFEQNRSYYQTVRVYFE